VFPEHSIVSRWFESRFPTPTPAQSAAAPHITAGEHVLIISPTGTGKTLAAFLPILHQLSLDHAAGRLPDSLQALYISPLRALAYDLDKNLNGPLTEAYAGKSPIRIGRRSGDTETGERRQQFEHPPHILLTTPESLGLLLSQTRWHEHLAQVRWIVVDEVHALAENKRGSDLSLSLERLSHLCGHGPQRIGLSATVSPSAEVASYLSGAGRTARVVEVATAKRIDLRVYTPLQREPYPAAGFSGARLIGELARLIQANRTTLVFTNTRSGAESATYWLREQHPALADLIECHHASLDRDLRLDVEDRLKRGELRAVVCSTSLELGIDIGSIDLVVMLATPKGVNRALQRTGRAGHRISDISHGLLMATNVGDLVECCATARLARAGHLDAVRIPRAPLDVLAQQLVGLGCTGEWQRSDAFALVQRAWPYRDLSLEDFDQVLDYLAGGGRSLRQQYTDVFGRIHLSETTFEARAGAPRRDYLQNIGTIATEGVIRVLLRNTQLGTVEEGFMRGLRVGDVFTLAGRPLRIERFGNMECWVARADGATPTVPRWGTNKFPLANRVAHEIRSFRSELRVRIEARQTPAVLIPWISKRLECGATNAAIIHRVHAAQHGVSEIPTSEVLLIEEYLDEPLPESFAPTTRPSGGPLARPRRMGRPPSASSQPPPPAEGQLAMPAIDLGGRSTKPKPARPEPPPDLPEAEPRRRHYFFHSLIGRAANDALSRVVGLRAGRHGIGNPVATADDYGFVLTIGANHQFSAADLTSFLDPAGFEKELEEVLRRSDLLKYHFRNAAQTGLMIYRNYFGEQKSARKLQWSSEVIFNVLVEHEPDHVLLREARRDAAFSFLDEARALAFLKDLDQRGRPIRLRTVAVVPPLSFGMYATRIREALLVEDPRETLERLYHHWWQNLAEPSPSGAATSSSPSPHSSSRA
jgi:ATP-dependent helicase Lhr and Lhr-like helicase